MTAPPDRLASVAREEQDGVVVASVQGEIDVSNATPLGHELTEVSNQALGLVVDLSQVSYLDSAAIALLYELHVRLERRGQMLVVVAPATGAPRRVLELTALGTRASVVDDLERAIATVRAIERVPGRQSAGS